MNDACILVGFMLELSHKKEIKKEAAQTTSVSKANWTWFTQLRIF